MALVVFSKVDKPQICKINLFGNTDRLREDFSSGFAVAVVASNVCGKGQMKSGFMRISVSRAD